MNEPTINLQFSNDEFELKLSAFDEGNVNLLLDTISDLQFETLWVGEWLFPYGDPAKSPQYRFGLRLPQKVNREHFADWIVKQLQSIQFQDGIHAQVHHVPEFQWTDR
jgi:hypothetical protein